MERPHRRSPAIAPLATAVNASEFYLWSSTRDGVDWSISPAGLSSNGYDGHLFWDAETWMYPSLLAQHPDLAAGMNTYRFDRLSAAQQHAAATGYQGARFPWESALDGTEQIPPPVSINSEGLYEVARLRRYRTRPVAVLPGDRRPELAGARGWPVISGAAAYWASKRHPSARTAVTASTTSPVPTRRTRTSLTRPTRYVAAMTVLRDATAAAQALVTHGPRRWTAIADRLVVPTRPANGRTTRSSPATAASWSSRLT